MWLFTPDGFYSVVDKHDEWHPGQLCVRARAAEDLANLRGGFLPKLGETIVGAGTDYPYRAWAPREDVAAWVSSQVMTLDYSNFKNEVARVQGRERAHIYGGVWTQMLKAEDMGVPS